MTKSQKQLIVLGVVVGAILTVLAIFVFKPQAVFTEVYVPKEVDTSISKDLLVQPEYRRLQEPPGVSLEIGRTGRDNPFDPY